MQRQCSQCSQALQLQSLDSVSCLTVREWACVHACVRSCRLMSRSRYCTCAVMMFKPRSSHQSTVLARSLSSFHSSASPQSLLYPNPSCPSSSLSSSSSSFSSSQPGLTGSISRPLRPFRSVSDRFCTRLVLSVGHITSHSNTALLSRSSTEKKSKTQGHSQNPTGCALFRRLIVSR
jgi:hypothetical protein